MTNASAQMLNKDEATALAIAFSNYSVAIKAYDEGCGLSVNDNVVTSGIALLAVQRIVGLEIAKPELVEKLIAEIRCGAPNVED